ncbi:MAG: CRISPR-associated endonuclease Cas2 [Patescibacteria group bacterium]|nr:CRISPR-associated endonuclease Cas2 [Patescibacteria group bacterium]
MGKLKDGFKNITLELIYEANRIFTCHSVVQYHLRECYKGSSDFDKEKEKIKKEKRRMEKRIDYLRRAGYIDVKNGEIKLSKKGLFDVLLYRSKKIKSSKSGKYFYLVIFDIPETMRSIRNLFRKVLYNFGSDRIQKSVFVIENKEALKLLKEIIKESDISKYVKIYRCIR